MVEERLILDYAARIGVQAKLDGMKRTHFEGILASLEAIEDERSSILVTATFAHRQAERLGRGSRTASLISEALRKIHSLKGGREDARRLLGLARWVFESIEHVGFPRVPDIRKLTLERFIEELEKVRLS